jgi:hypothetical protein
MSRLKTRTATRAATCPAAFVRRRPIHPLACVLSALLLVGSTGCATRADRPDAEVARVVEREDLRVARLTAVAALDLESFEILSAGVAIESMALLMVGDERHDASTTPDDGAEPLGAAPGWHYDAPASWGARPWSFAAGEGMDGSLTQRLKSAGGKDSHEGALAIETGEGEGRGGGKPKVRFNFLRMRVKDRPISFSGSVKGLKSVQLKATIKL